VDEDFEEQQHMVARLVSSAVKGETPEAHLKMLQLARRHFGTGGVQRLRYTLPPVIFSCLGLARELVAASAAGAHRPNPYP
jgi:vacuolar protein sorting-associated protein 35